MTLSSLFWVEVQFRAAAAPLCRLYSNVHVDFLEQKVLELEGTSEISSSRPLVSGRGEGSRDTTFSGSLSTPGIQLRLLPAGTLPRQGPSPEIADS